MQITATSVTQTTDPFNLQPSTQTEQSLGSGFVIDKAGHIVTNYHVVQGATKVQVSFSGQDQLAATVVGSDPSTDTAVLKVDAHARALTPLPLGDSDAVIVGDPVYAIGNPFGFTRTLTSGLVSAVQRQIEAPNTLSDRPRDPDRRGDQPRQLGRPADRRRRPRDRRHLADLDRHTGQQGNVGIGFAIPINTVRNVAAQIITPGKAQHAFLGVTTFPLTKQLAQLFKLPTDGDARPDDPEGERRRQRRAQGRQDEGDRRRRLLHDRRRHHRRVDGTPDHDLRAAAGRDRQNKPATRSSSRSTATARRRPSR